MNTNIKTIKRPNLFIVGASKCGTTALYNYLRLHPKIYFCDIKEPKYFGSDLPFKSDRYGNKLERYLELFIHAGKHKIIGEASTNYLYSKKAAFEIKKFNPNAKIIIMLRNPVDQIYSRYSQLFSLGIESLLNFEDALKIEKHRKKLSKKNKYIRLLLYRNIANYYEQVKRYYDLFGKNKIHIIIFDDFIKDTAEVYKKVLDFLKIDNSYRPDFIKLNTNRVQNKNKIPRIWIFEKILYKQPKFIMNLANKNKYISKLGMYLYLLITKYNHKYKERKPMTTKLRNQLKKEFTPDIKKLEVLTQKDLSGWYK